MNFEVIKLKPFGVLVVPKDESLSLSEIDITELREIFLQEQILVLRGFKPFNNSEEFSDYCAKWGEICLWPFGKVLELVEHDDPKDHIFDSSYVPLHWDGMYRPQVPEYQIFNCVTAPLPGQGGRTTFSNTILALQNADDDTKKLWTKVTGNYQRQMEFYKSKTVSPIITNHPLRDYPVIRYNEPPIKEKGHFVNPPDLEFTGIETDEQNHFHQSLQDSLYDSKNFYAHEWQNGDVVITDNFSLLHGREGFTSKSPRHIQRVQVLSNPPFNNPGLESYQ